MSLWLKVRTAPSTTTVIAFGGLALIAARDFAFPFPNLVGSSFVPVPMVFVPPLFVAIALARALPASTHDDLEVVSIRNMRLRDSCCVLVVCGISLAFCVVWSQLFGGLVLGAGRDAIGYVGLMLIGRWILGASAAATLPSAYIVIASLTRTGAGFPAGTWGWALASHDNVASWVAALGLLAIGMAVGVRSRS